jgi:hypothetical protein
MASLRPSARSVNTRLIASKRAASTGKQAGSHLHRLLEGRPVIPLFLRENSDDPKIQT